MSEQFVTKKELDEKIDEVVIAVKNGFDSMHEEFKSIKALMVTKDYLDDKLAELEGSTIVRQRKQDKKMNLMAELLKEKKIFGDDDLKRLQEIQVFPAPPAL